MQACSWCSESRRDWGPLSSPTSPSEDDISSSRPGPASERSIPYGHLPDSVGGIACRDIHLAIAIEVADGQAQAESLRACRRQPRLCEAAARQQIACGQIEFLADDWLVVEDPRGQRRP